ncbi:MAG: hypothetical protein Q7K57_54625 [Burkholderiaceae bacterium]|nr:hypothetical protein [Burkholderiaceae bacterium]
MLVNPKVLERPEFGPLRQSLLEEAVRAQAVIPLVVRPHESLSSIVAREYGYGDNKEHRELHSELVDAIKQINGRSDGKIFAGEEIGIPSSLRRPNSRGSSVSLAQVLDISSSRRASSVIASLTKGSNSKALAATTGVWSSQKLLAALGNARTNEPSASNSRAAAVGAVRMDLAQFKRLGGANLLRTNKEDIGIPPVTDDYILDFVEASTALVPTTSTGASETMKLSSEQLQTLAQGGQGKLYILDVFSTDGITCSHGDLVYEKAIQSLRAMGAEGLSDRIVKFPIDFYSDRVGNTKFIENWVNQKGGYIRESYQAALASLKSLRTPPTDALRIPIPGLFLQAIYSTLVQKEDALVIAGSFTTLSNTHVFPQDILLSNGSSLVSAVLNDDGSTVEGANQRFQEPLRTFSLYSNELGTVLVGYRNGNGPAKGMYSAMGTGVTTLDDGVVIGEVGACHGQRAMGASFATPLVAAKLLVGRLFWPKKGGQVDALAARKRLLNSGTVEGALVGKYWSAGTPSLERLLRPSGAGFFLTDGRVIDASKYVGKMFVSIKHPGPVGQLNLLFGGDGGDGSQAFSAIQFGSTATYLMNSRSLTWQEVQIDHICICDGIEHRDISHSEAIKSFKELAYYE